MTQQEEEKDKSLSTIRDGQIVGKGDWDFDLTSLSPNEDVYSLEDLIGGGYDDMWLNKNHCRYVVIKGSRASKKSFTVAYKIITGMMENPHVNTLVMRATYNSLKGSCWSLLKKIVYKLKVQKDWKISQSPLEFVYKPTGQQILFRGLNDPLALSSIGVDNAGVLCWAWLEEAYQVSRLEDFEKVNQSIRGSVPEGTYKQIFITFNPWLRSHWLRTRFFETEDGRPLEDPDVLAMTTCYLQNEWLDEADYRMFNRMKELNPQMYEVAGLGNWGNPQGLIYNNWEDCDFRLEDIRKLPGITLCIGLDFGYSEDPAALCVSYVDTINNVIYIWDEMYETHLSNSQLAKRIKDMGYGKETIVADSEAPKDIDELQREYGLTHIVPAYKYPGSVLSQIQRVQDYRIKVHPRCVNFRTEIQSYAWKVDNEGRTLAVPAPYSMDHLCLINLTNISTDKGDIPIKDIKVGDMVLTRKGYRKVVAVGITGRNIRVMRLVLKDGTELIGTGNHPIGTTGGFICINRLMGSIGVLKCINVSNMKVKDGELIDCQVEENPDITRDMEYICTDTSGRNTTDQSQKECTSTIKMGTQTTTTSQISKWSQSRNIGDCIKKEDTSSQLQGNMGNANPCQYSERSGIGQMKVSKNIRKSSPNQESERKRNSFANGVERNITHIAMGGTSVAPPDVVTNMTKRQVSTANTEYANGVGKNISPHINTKRQGSVQNHAQCIPVTLKEVGVERIEDAGIAEEVYNLTVEGEHEFFANGILTHNCDAMKYSLDILDHGAGEYIGSVGDKEEQEDLRRRYGDKKNKKDDDKKEDDDNVWCIGL